MRASHLLCLAAALVGAERTDCDACLHGQCYLKQPLPWPSEALLDIDRNKNTLYLTHGNNTINLCSLEAGTCNKVMIESMDGSASIELEEMLDFAVDQNTGNIYMIVGMDRIFKLDLINNTKELLVGVDSAMQITFKEKLYYACLGNGILTYENGESLTVPGTEGREAIGNIIVDRYDDIYFKDFTEFSGVIRRLSGGVVNQTEFWDSSYYLTVDKDGNAVFIHPETHVVYIVTYGQLTEAGVLNTMSYSTYPLFDGDNNIICKDGLPKSEEYFHLKRERDVNCTTNVEATDAAVRSSANFISVIGIIVVLNCNT